MNGERDAPSPVDAPIRQTRGQRRVLRTRSTIEDAFIAAVSERGYHSVSVEEIAEAADVAKATFYAHFDNKEALLEAVFARLAREVTERVLPPGPISMRNPLEAVQSLFEQAGQLSDLYRVCLRHGRTRSQYQAFVADVIERAFDRRAQEFRLVPRVPARAAALAFAGSHTALLEAWLDGELSAAPEQMAAIELALVLPGLRCAIGETDPAGS